MASESKSQSKLQDEKSKAYKAGWIKGKRSRVKENHDDNGDEDFLKAYSDPTTVLESIKFYEKRLYELRHPIAAANVDLSPQVLHIDLDATEAFRAELNELSTLPLTERADRLTFMGQKLENIGRYFTHADVSQFRDRLRKEAAVVHDRRERVAYYERMIPLWERGGALRLEAEAVIRIDRQAAQVKLNQQDPSQKREGLALLNSCEKRLGQLEVTLGTLKAELAALKR
jgi:hypothetical protein